MLKLKTPDNESATQVLNNICPQIDSGTAKVLIQLAKGSPGMAIHLYEKSAIQIYQKIVDIFAKLPDSGINEVHDLGDKIAGKSSEFSWPVTTYLLEYFISEIAVGGVNDNFSTQIVKDEQELKNKLANKCSLEKWADLWEKTGKTAREAENFNLDKKHSLMKIFNDISKAIA